jgi:hypothetical protein
MEHTRALRSVCGGISRLSVAVVLATLASPQIAHAQSSLKFGTWRLDPERSELGGEPPRWEIRKYEDRGGGVVHSTREGLNSRGEPFFSMYAAKFDGKDYPRVVMGSGSVSTIAFTRVDDYSENFAVKVEGRLVFNGNTRVSEDGQTLTTTIWQANDQGPPSISVYVRQD